MTISPWLFLLAAAACEMIWPISAKYTHGFKENYPLIALTFAVMILSFFLMTKSIDPAKPNHIPVSIAYAVWTAIGTAGTAILGMILFKESHDTLRLLCLTLIITGVVGLKFLAPPETKTPEAPPGRAGL